MRAAIRLLRFLDVLWLTLFASSAFALGPSEVFEKAAPSVLGVRALDSQGKPLAFGSAVVIGPGKLVTSCHVLAKASKIELVQEGSTREATLQQADVERDLCVISAQGLAAPALALAPQPAKIGQRVYAIGVPARLELSMAEGMMSGTRSSDATLPPLQTTAPLSPGQSGGGLFNEQAQLVGITTLNVARGSIAANINFASPAAWLSEIGPRSQQQLAERRLRPPSAAAQGGGKGMPVSGAHWRYRYRDQQYHTGEKLFTVEILGVEGYRVQERFAVEGGQTTQAPVEAESLRFITRPLSSSASVIELAPYAPGLYNRVAAVPSGYPSIGGATWTIDTATYAEEKVTVAAGTYPAIRVEVKGQSTIFVLNNTTAGQAASFLYTAWYSVDMKRYVKIRHQTWGPTGRRVGDDEVELVEYRAPPVVQQRDAAPAGITTLDLEPIAMAAATGSATAAKARPKEVALKAIVLNLSGAGAATGSEDWEKFKAECAKQLSTSSEKRGSKFSSQEGEPRALKESGTLVAVYVNGFNYVSPGARVMGGMLAGTATVDAKVTFRDLQTGEQISERTYTASSADMSGIGTFAAASNRVLEDLAERILGDLERQ